MFRKLSIRDVELKGRRVLVRVDFNVPLDETNSVTDNTRIRESLPTIRYILQSGGSVVLMSHLGRPKGKRNEKYSLMPVATELSRLLARPVALAPDCIDEVTHRLSSELEPGGVLLLQNLRFHPGEEANDPVFAGALAANGDLFCNDAFGASHRAHASVVGVAEHLTATMGFLVEKELAFFGKALSEPDPPFVAIVGGAKVSDKLPVLRNLVELVDSFIIGGGMCYTFLKARGVEIGLSKVEPEQIEMAAETLAMIEKKGKTVYLPIDHVIADAFAPNANVRVVKGNIPDGWMGLDIGPETSSLFQAVARNAGTAVWNGPLGVFEMAPFAAGTRDMCAALAECHGTTIIGGGDTAAAVANFGYADKMSHISTGGGASLELLQGLVLPGVAALRDK